VNRCRAACRETPRATAIWFHDLSCARATAIWFHDCRSPGQPRRPRGHRVQLRQLLTWSTETGDVTDPLTLMEVGPVSFEEIDPATGGVGNTGPPTAA
jgi:hypothetical protein